MLIADANRKYIFRNLLVISLHLFKALEYFDEKGLVHRDVKRMEMYLCRFAQNSIIIIHLGSNILLKLACSCPSAIMCTCDGRGSGTALLSDFDLVEKATSDGKWARLRDSEPAGTRGMKAPEVNN